MDQPDLLGLFAQLMREQFGLELREAQEPADPKLDALIEAFASAVPAAENAGVRPKR